MLYIVRATLLLILIIVYTLTFLTSSKGFYMSTVYQEVTDSIIKQLENGATPWIKPWKTDSTADKNFITQAPYRGVNRLMLGLSSMINGYTTPVWATFKQWNDLGRVGTILLCYI